MRIIEILLLFDLTMHEKQDPVKAKKKTLEEATEVVGIEEVNSLAAEAHTMESSLRLDFSEEITSTFGETVAEDNARRSMNLFGFVDV